MPSPDDPFLESLERFDFRPRTSVVFGEGSMVQLGGLATGLGFHQTLIVADPGLVVTGHADLAKSILQSAGIQADIFQDFDTNPDGRMVEAGRRAAEASRVDSLVALGGGSSLDTAKGINFVLTNGGTMRDYWGFGKATRPMLPSIGIPTTAGTGSEAQSYAIISDPDTHEKMACGDPQAAFRYALLDPLLTVTQPARVTAVAGYDALSHAVESFVTTKRTEISDLFAQHAWRLLEAHYERVLLEPNDVAVRGAMLLGSHEAGIAIEQSMLGAAHACANPLTARYGTTHGVAVGVMLAHVVRWNGAYCRDRYAELLRISWHETEAAVATPGDSLASRLDSLAHAGDLPRTLRDLNVPREDLPALAEDAAKQWTGTFNPRPFDAGGALHLYECAY